MTTSDQNNYPAPPPSGAPVIVDGGNSPFYKKWWFITIVILAGILIIGSIASSNDSSPSGDAVEETIAMPNLAGERLDVALSDLAALGIDEGDVEIVGGGTFGIVDQSNWTVCEHNPLAEQPLTPPFRLIVDRSCPETGEPVTEPVEESSTEEPSASETTSEPDSPIIFRASTQGNIDDFRKDLNDLVTAIDENSVLRIATNIAELSFNIGQLQAANPPVEIADQWNTQLAALDSAVTNLNNVVTEDGTMSDLKVAVKATRTELNALEGVLANLD